MTTGVTSRWWWTVAAPLLAPLVACGGSGGSIEASGRIADVPVTPGVGEANAEHTAARPRSNGGVSLARAVAGAAAERLVGVFIALIQALTQVQEATLTFVPKILAIFAALLLLAPVASAQLMSFTEQVYQHIETGF